MAEALFGADRITTEQMGVDLMGASQMGVALMRAALMGYVCALVHCCTSLNLGDLSVAAAKTMTVNGVHQELGSKMMMVKLHT